MFAIKGLRSAGVWKIMVLLLECDQDSGYAALMPAKRSGSWRSLPYAAGNSKRYRCSYVCFHELCNEG